MSCKEYPNRNCIGCPECRIELATRLLKNKPTLNFNPKELLSKGVKVDDTTSNSNRNNRR